MATDEKPVEIDSWSRTKAAKSAKGNFCWTIENFSGRKECNQEEITSERFAISRPNGRLTWWYLSLYPRGSTDTEATERVSIFINSLNDFSVVKPILEISLLDESNRRLKRSVFDNLTFYGNKEDTESIAQHGWAKFIKRNELLKNSELLPNGNLVIFCEITVFEDEKTDSGSRFAFMGKQPDVTQDLFQSLSDDFGRAFSDNDSSDVCVNCGEKNFYCHEFVLSVRSPVFRAMFNSNMSESNTKNIFIADISPDVIEKMIKYIYTAKVVLDEQSKTRELLIAANKYELEMLKIVCENKLCEELEVKNSVENLIFGDMYGATKLKKNAMQLLANNMNSVLDTEDWVTFSQQHPALVTEVMRVIVKTKGENELASMEF